MSNFIQYKLDIGTVKELSNNPAVFYKTPECKKIMGLEPGCRCTSASNEPNFVSTIFVPDYIPDQMGNQMSIKKGITVTFEDGTQERLEIIGVVTK